MTPLVRPSPRRPRPAALALAVVAVAVAGLCGADGPLRPEDDPYARLTSEPLTVQTWPKWREVYLERFYNDDHEISARFHERVADFLGGLTHAPGPDLPGPLAQDPVAWVALGDTAVRTAWPGRPAVADFDRAEQAYRRAIALGDPRAVGSYSLAVTLTLRAEAGGRPPSEFEGSLAEAKRLLDRVASASTAADVDLWLGRIAIAKGDYEGSFPFLERAVADHPKSEWAARSYMTALVSTKYAPPNLAKMSARVVGRFPNDPVVQSLQAVVLYRDARFPEAGEALDRVRRQGVPVDEVLGPKMVRSIDEMRNLPEKTVQGLQELGQRRYSSARMSLRMALDRDPESRIAARGLATALAMEFHDVPFLTRRDPAAVADEIAGLCKRFPGEPEMEAALAVASFSAGRNLAAGEAVERVRSLGRHPAEVIDPATLMQIRRAAHEAEANQSRARVVLMVVGGLGAWIGLMFATGALLAVCTPRVPSAAALSPQGRSIREVWLERFYLVALGVCLLVFYLTVPFVALGLLAVTLALFALLLVFRVFHFGLLYRGLWATGNVLKCAVIGADYRVSGIEATPEAHPRLFKTLREVADAVQTRPVDTVYLTPFSAIGVREEGSGPFGLFGKQRRVLALGVPLLPLLGHDEFKAILAHEYGHFCHRDPLYSRFISQVSASLATSLAVMNAAAGFLNYVNPFHWFWWAYLHAYTLLSRGFSRSREFLADRRAVAAYGRGPFVSGLTKSCVDGALFDSTMYPEVARLLAEGQALTNAFYVFRAVRTRNFSEEERREFLDRLRGTPARWFDTHPSYSERVAALAGFPDHAPAGSVPCACDAEAAIDLLDDTEQLETELTRILTRCVFEQVSSGVEG
ncbi:MAG: M48 family metalloprotease [Isosphaeraceae bacterium]